MSLGAGHITRTFGPLALSRYTAGISRGTFYNYFPDKESVLRALVEQQGFTIEQEYQFNRAGTLPWWAFSRAMGAGNISKLVLKTIG